MIKTTLSYVINRTNLNENAVVAENAAGAVFSVHPELRSNVANTITQANALTFRVARMLGVGEFDSSKVSNVRIKKGSARANQSISIDCANTAQFQLSDAAVATTDTIVYVNLKVKSFDQSGEYAQNRLEFFRELRVQVVLQPSEVSAVPTTAERLAFWNKVIAAINTINYSAGRYPFTTSVSGNVVTIALTDSELTLDVTFEGENNRPSPVVTTFAPTVVAANRGELTGKWMRESERIFTPDSLRPFALMRDEREFSDTDLFTRVEFTYSSSVLGSFDMHNARVNSENPIVLYINEKLLADNSSVSAFMFALVGGGAGTKIISAIDSTNATITGLTDQAILENAAIGITVS